MATPYDGKIYLVQVKGSFLPRKSISDVARMIAETMPEVDGVFLQTSQGKEWQSKFDNDPKAVNGPAAIAQWVSALEARGLETHVWGIPHGLNVPEEANLFIQAAKVQGVKSLLLDVEHGDFYYRGTAQGASQMMQTIRGALGADYHIGFILDARKNRPMNVYVDPWMPFMNSVHPMIYPKDFAKPVAAALDTGFAFLAPYGKPIVPMLQSYNGVNPADIIVQGDESFKRGAVGLSFFCLGDRHMGEAEFKAVAAIKSPGKQKRPVPEILPPGAVGVWPDDPRNYIENVYEIAPSRPWHDFRDSYGRAARWKLTSASNDVAVTYVPQLPAPGRYNIEVFIPYEEGESRRADYHILYFENGQQKEKQVKIDQSARSNEWVSLGVFDLNPAVHGDGRVNITDFSDEQPPMPVAFAGVRWVPVAAQPAAQPAAGTPNLAAMSEARRLAMQGASGGTTASTPSPQTTPAVTSAITNQDVINAFIVGASKFGDKFTDLISAAGLTSIYNERKAVYAGSAIAALGNIGTDRRAAIAEALRLPAADLARAAAQASKPPAPPKGAIDGRTWGVHGAAGSAAPPRDKWDFWIREIKEMGLKWYKQCDSTGPDDLGEGSIFRWVLALRDAGITPVIRYQQGHQFPNRLDHARFDKMKSYVREGIIWAEIGNEPNLSHEWAMDHNQFNINRTDVYETTCNVWLQDAEEALRVGARPSWYAMAPTDWQGGENPVASGPKMQELCWRYLGRTARDRARAIFRNGGWVAVHVAVYEFPLDHDPFNHGIGGRAPWDMCLRGYEIPLKYIADNIGLTAGVDMPMMSTESGVFTPESRSMDGHQRLPNDDAHGQLTLKMFDWLEENSPLQAMMPWVLAVHDAIGLNNPDFPADGWFVDRGGLQPRSVVGLLKNARKQRGWA